MPVVSTWTCETVVGGENCYATGFGVATVSAATSTPLYTQDAGDLQYGIAWLVFFSAMIFLGIVYNAAPFPKK